MAGQTTVYACCLPWLHREGCPPSNAKECERITCSKLPSLSGAAHLLHAMRRLGCLVRRACCESSLKGYLPLHEPLEVEPRGFGLMAVRVPLAFILFILVFFRKTKPALGSSARTGCDQREALERSARLVRLTLYSGKYPQRQAMRVEITLRR